MHVLLLEFYTLMARCLKRGLEDDGFSVEQAGDTDEADRRLRLYDYDVVLLDLPRDEGFTALRNWREMGIQIPVLVLTSSNFPPADASDFDWGISRVLAKPFRLAELLARLRTLAQIAPKCDSAAQETWDELRGIGTC